MESETDAAHSGRREPPSLGEFLGEPTRDLSAWHWLWEKDRGFPIRSHRRFGGFLVALKRFLRPLFVAPQKDLWDRQRVFNLVLLEHLQGLERTLAERDERLHRLEGRTARLEELGDRGLLEIMTQTDALYARLDQKLDRHQREARELRARLGAALAKAEAEGGASPIARAHEEFGYLEFERRFRGTREEISQRLEIYLPRLAGRGEVLDLGCGRGEALALFGARGISAHGVDSSAEMVAACREQGSRAQEGDLLERLAGEPEATLGAVVSFHVIEHLPADVLDRLIALAWRALRPGGLLVLETPSPLSLLVAARNFWIDPTHRRPVHPESLKQALRSADFDPVEQLDLRPFPPSERLPEIDLAALPPEQRELGDRVNRLRDRIDDLLFGFQDYAVIGTKPPK